MLIRGRAHGMPWAPGGVMHCQANNRGSSTRAAVRVGEDGPLLCQKNLKHTPRQWFWPRCPPLQASPEFLFRAFFYYIRHVNNFSKGSYLETVSSQSAAVFTLRPLFFLNFIPS